MKRPKFKGGPVTRWIGGKQRWRINFVYCTPWGQFAVPVVIIGFVVMVLAGWLLDEERASIHGAFALDLLHMVFGGALYGFTAAVFFCPHRVRIEISRHSITFGKPPHKRAYSVAVPREFIMTPLPKPHPTGFHKNAVVLTLRFGQHAETFTVWNGTQDADELIERFETVLDAVGQGKKTLPGTEEAVDSLLAIRERHKNGLN